MKIITATGSVYIITKDNGKWWMTAKNVPNPYSDTVDGAWEIKEPKIKLGQSAELVSVYVDEPNHPQRIKGGGKITSPVIAIEE